MDMPGLFESERDKKSRYDKTVAALKQRHSKLKSAKQPWHTLWQFVSEYVMQRHRNFDGSTAPGQFTTADIYSSQPAKNCYKAASLIAGMLWNSGSKSFVLLPPEAMDEQTANSEEIKDWYSKVLTRKVHSQFSERSMFSINFIQAIHEATGYGTGGLLCIRPHSMGTKARNNKDKVLFKTINVKRSCIDEGREGYVDTVFTEYEYTVRQLIQEFGRDAVSKQVLKQFDSKNGSDLENKVKIVHVIEPVNERKDAPIHEEGMTFVSTIYEDATNWIVSESTFESNPALVFRFWKHCEEVYGRGPGTESMPDILTLNGLEETILVGSERIADPPTWSYDDGFMGGGTINKSAGANNPLRIPAGSRQAGFSGQPMGPIFTVGDLGHTEKRIETKKQEIADSFFLDLLTELEQQRMTLGEFTARQSDRFAALVLLFLRIQSEMLDPCIERVFNMCLADGDLGVTPGSPEEQAYLKRGVPQSEIPYIPLPVFRLMLAGEDVFRIKYLTYAARMLNQQLVQGMVTMLQDVGEVAKLNPAILDIFNWEAFIRQLQELRGAPDSVVKSDEMIKQMRQQKQAFENEQADISKRKLEAEIQKDASQAAKNAAAASALPVGLIQ